MIQWHQTLVREVAARRCVFFLGAGVSASATDDQGHHPKTWEEFLSEACQLIPKKATQQAIGKLLKNKKYLLALQGIRDAVDPGEYRSLLNNHFNNPQYKPNVINLVALDIGRELGILKNALFERER